MADLPRAAIAEKSLMNSKLILFKDIAEAVTFSNHFAPEHLIVMTRNTDLIISEITNAGSVFIGEWTPEAAGDYASGTNHTLPTGGFARSYSGVSLDSFYKNITFQKLSPAGIQNIGPVISIMAEAEQLAGHANSVNIRLKALSRRNQE
jgi:histidinol dehydrogenase